MLLGELRGESLIVDDGAFVACVGDISVGRHVNHGFAQAVGSGEGRVQPKLTGSGLFALQSPVPPEEFQVLDLRGDTLKVDGNLVVAYTDGLEFKVEKSARPARQRQDRRGLRAGLPRHRPGVARPDPPLHVSH